MKKQTTLSWFIVLFTMSLGFTQNRSFVPVTSPIPAAVPPLPATTTEVFRFNRGLVTQLDSGSGFDFSTSSQWFSLGKLTPSATAQTLYGFRIQRAGRGLVFGYSGPNQPGSAPTTPGNPFIQWLGSDTNFPATTQGNLEFRTSSSSVNPASDRLAFTLRSTLTALLGEATTVPVGGTIPKLEINSQSTGLQVGLLVDVSGGSGGSQARAAVLRAVSSPNSSSGVVETTSLETFTNGSFNTNYGVKTMTGTGAQTNVGVYAELSNLNTNGAPITTANQNYGFRSRVTSPGLTSSSYGTFSQVGGPTVTGGIRYGIYAAALGTQATGAGPTGNFAGFFDGHIFATTSFFGSDSKLKKDVKNEEKALEKLKQLNPVTYNFIDDYKKTNLNLPTSLQHGFIAQELEKVYPELVIDFVHPTFNDQNEQIGTTTTKAVNYIGLISVLTKSLKEMSEEVAVLKDKLATTEKTYVVNTQKNFTESELQAIQSNGYYLGQNTPNPFRTSTVIEYSLPEGETEASILLLNLNGQTLREFKLTAIKGSITIESNTMQKGMYLYSLIANGEEIATKKMIVN